MPTLLNVMSIIFFVMGSGIFVFAAIDYTSTENKSGSRHFLWFCLAVFLSMASVYIHSNEGQGILKNILPTTYAIKESIKIEKIDSTQGCEIESYLMEVEEKGINKIIFRVVIEGRAIMKTLEAGTNPVITTSYSNGKSAELQVMKKVYENKKIETILPYGNYGTKETKVYKLVFPRKCKLS